MSNGQINKLSQALPFTNDGHLERKGENRGESLFKRFFNEKYMEGQGSNRQISVPALISNKSFNAEGKADKSAEEQKTFRECESNIAAAGRKSSFQGKKSIAADNGTGSETMEADSDLPEMDKTSMVINCLAQVMGVQAGDIIKLLESKGVKPEEISSISKTGTLGSKLAELFRLDSQMEEALTKIIQTIDSQIGEAMKKVLQDSNGRKIQWVKLGDIKLGMITDNKSEAQISGESSDTKTPVLSGIMLKFKRTLKDLGEKLKINEEAFLQEISFKLHPILKNGSAILKISLNPELTESDAGNGTEKNELMDDAAVNGCNKDQKGKMEADSVQQISAKPEVQGEFKGNTIAIGQIQVGNHDSNAGSIRMTALQSGREIMYQIIEKAKVILSPDKSEMIIDLKPESLGKLSLKVTTEHGMVMARFIADNQQIKQVLETNMQLLKESLEKQGLNVEGFSVSVRQDSQERTNHNSYGDGSRRFPHIQIPGSVYAEAGRLETLNKINPYKHEGNTINLTA